MVFRTFVQAIAKRVPMIKFRRQRLAEAATGQSGSGASVISVFQFI